MESDTTESSATATIVLPPVTDDSAKIRQTTTEQQSESVVVEETRASTENLRTTDESACGGGDGNDGFVKNVGDESSPPPNKRQKVADNDAAPAVSEDHVVDSVEQVQSTQSNLRRFKRIPVFIVDYHNDVLEFLYRCLATRHLPLEKNILVHFDSHPDLVIARDIPASASYDKDTMLTELSIENWIMPTLYAGHFNRMVWLKNSWCQQIPTGKHCFNVGHKDDRIGIDCALDYFIADGNYCATDELQESRSIELQVYDADTDKLDPTEFLNADDASNFVLDIDLDFFSTSNPFLEIYKDADCYTQLKDIFHFESVENDNSSPADNCASAERRKKQLEALRNIFWHLESKRSFEGLEPPDTAVVNAETYAKVVKLAEVLQSKYPDDEIDWLLIFDSGSTTDNNGLPHHISTSKELEEYFAYFKQFLQRLPVPPVAITMAHSAQDDYCPQNQVAFIQAQVLRLLREVFGDKMHEQPILHYMDDEWDVMKL